VSLAVACGGSGGRSQDAGIPDAGPPATRIAITPASASVERGVTVQLSASVADADGHVLAGAPITWSSSNAGVASVNSAGLATALGVGGADLLARSGSVSAEAHLTVLVPVAASVQIVETIVAALASVGATAQLHATSLDVRGTAIPEAVFTWSSSAPGVVTAATHGLVTAAAIVTSTLHAASGAKSGAASVSVTSPAVAAVAIAETNPALLMFLGATLQLHANAIDARGAAIPEAVFNWSSSAPGVATVDTHGRVAAVASGPAQVTASSGGKAASLAISVSQTVATVAVSTPGGAPAQLGAFNATVQLTAQASDSGGHALGGITFAWTSSDATIASVDTASGLLTAHKNGSASITAAASGPSGSATVTVLQHANSTSVLPASASIERGATQAFTASSADSNGNPVVGLTPVWTVDSGGVATIAQTGVATGQVVGATHVHGVSGQTQRHARAASGAGDQHRDGDSPERHHRQR